jgi:hypothetical protein
MENMGRRRRWHYIHRRLGAPYRRLTLTGTPLLGVYPPLLFPASPVAWGFIPHLAAPTGNDG